ncbi:MAG: methylenetetrahydrofolate--tRNA-(uracil(54)-C(5))-methyltransferase (FADH(2)-oxidizing) TrmFO [Clostridia bacterium]|nr:methylenetetrahydrofolate--tRNA-(uracil(54)-C(5))-methyltransferase (FADH(2)-oxidizing) TrmFO [Clostridia bacterium]
MEKTVSIIGGGLAGCECALFLADHGVKVKLYEIKPIKYTPAHHSESLAELVCSNSLKSNDIYGNACGLLKEEMRILGSSLIKIADQTKVPAGNALAVNREEFSTRVTNLVKSNTNIEVIAKEVTSLDDFDGHLVVATGPLTTDDLAKSIFAVTGQKMFFFDAAAPIISADSIDMESAFVGDRWDKGNGDHINCPMNKEEYEKFLTELLSANRAEQKDFENSSVFEGCMPVEVMASRGVDTLRFGPLKPAGLTDPKTGRWPYACLQLRREDKDGQMYNLVGFQTNLLWGEQKRVFGLIPALKNAEYYRYGVMHKNSYIRSPGILSADFSLIKNDKIFFAGQITGVEGYVESMASGLLVAINILLHFANKPSLELDNTTVLGALSNYIATPSPDFQPMNANFGILKNIEMVKKDKALKKRLQAERSLEVVKEIKKYLDETI